MGRHCDDIIYTPSIPQHNVIIISHADMLNVGGLPLGDITNVCQPTTVADDDKKEQLKSRRRAADRKKKEEADNKQKDENLTAITISGMDVYVSAI